MSDTIKELTDELNVNVTLVASEDIYDKNGNLIEIRTIEFTVPKANTSKPATNEESSDDDDVWSQIVAMIKEVEDLHVVNMKGQMSYDSFNDDGTVNEAVFVEKDYIYAFVDGIGGLNRTLRATNEEVQKYINEKQGGQNRMAVLTYDEDGNVVESKSEFSAIPLVTNN